MKKRGAVLTVLAIVIVALGFYRGWFAFVASSLRSGKQQSQSQPDGGSGQSETGCRDGEGKDHGAFRPSQERDPRTRRSDKRQQVNLRNDQNW